MRLNLASRRSDLARIQCQAVGRALQQAHPNLEINYIFRESLGDKNQDQPLWKMPEKGVFTEDFVSSLRSGEIDAVVHSWKDLPVEGPEDLPIFGVLEREDPRDLLLVKKTSLAKIKQQKSIAVFSSSPRREFCLEKSLGELWPHSLTTIKTIPVRGNIATRLKKLLQTEDIDALMVAKAALDRLQTATAEEYQESRKELREILAQLTWMCLPLSEFPTAPAQGALALQFRTDRADLRQLFASIRNEKMEFQVGHERRRLAEVGGGCHQKLGCTMIEIGDSHFEFFRRLKADGSQEHELGRSIFPQNKKTDDLPQMWSTESWSKHRVACKISVSRKNLETPLLLVSKAEAWPEHFTPQPEQIIWAAGLETWKKLAAQGVWIHGSADRQGLKSPSLGFWFDHPVEYRKLTHKNALFQPEDVATYEIKWNEDLPPPDLCGSYYFGSAFEAKEFIKRYPPRPGDRWFCGLGKTFEELSRICPTEIRLQPIWRKDL